MTTGYSQGVIHAELKAHDDHVDCSWRDDDETSASGPAQQIQVDWQPVGEKGRRPWFICRGCRMRRRSLYFVKPGFGPVELVCRKCAGLRYPSQDADPVERLASEISLIHSRLGSRVAADPYYIRRASWPARPKGMHMRVYRDLLTELADKQAEMDAAIASRSLRLVSQVDVWLSRHT